MRCRVSIRLAEGLGEHVPWLVRLPRRIVGTVKPAMTEIVPVQSPRHLLGDAVHEHIGSAQPVEQRERRHIGKVQLRGRPVQNRHRAGLAGGERDDRYSRRRVACDLHDGFETRSFIRVADEHRRSATVVVEHERRQFGRVRVGGIAGDSREVDTLLRSAGIDDAECGSAASASVATSVSSRRRPSPRWSNHHSLTAPTTRSSPTRSVPTTTTCGT